MEAPPFQFDYEQRWWAKHGRWLRGRGLHATALVLAPVALLWMLVAHRPAGRRLGLTGLVALGVLLPVGWFYMC